MAPAIIKGFPQPLQATLLLITHIYQIILFSTFSFAMDIVFLFHRLFSYLSLLFQLHYIGCI